MKSLSEFVDASRMSALSVEVEIETVYWPGCPV